MYPPEAIDFERPYVSPYLRRRCRSLEEVLKVSNHRWAHQWVPSTFGHGTICARCWMTIRRAAVTKFITCSLAEVEAVARAIFYGMKVEAWGRAEGTRRADAVWPADEKAWRAYPHNPVAEVDLAFAGARAAIAAHRAKG